MGRAGALRLAVGRPSCTVCTQEAAARVGHGMLVFSNHNSFSLPSSYFFCVWMHNDGAFGEIASRLWPAGLFLALFGCRIEQSLHCFERE